MPAMPLPLPVAAAMVPATCVPCQEELEAGMPAPHSFALYQSPGSAGLLSRPLPSTETAVSEMKRYPPTMFAARSEWVT
ncbi:hypothetical protein SVIOM74S_05459 [Streptomyces violarus]